MSAHAAFRRQPVPQQYAQNLQTVTIPAPTRGIVISENPAVMQPGAALVQDNWLSTMRGVKVRGGSIRWCDLHALDAVVPPVPSPDRQPVVSAFEYIDGNSQRMFAAQQTKLFDVTGNTPVLVKSGQTSGNYSTSQLTNVDGMSYLIAVNDAGDPPLRFDGTTWTTLDAGQITGPVGTPVVAGANLSYVCKYKGRWYFIENKSMNIYYLGVDSIGGLLTKIPMSGATTRGGYALFLAIWSLDAGDGLDDKLVVATSEGELIVWTGSNPADPANWRQEGRYTISPPLGMNAHMQIGGELFILTVDGMVPISQAISKSPGQLDLAMVTLPIKHLWREEVIDKRDLPWTIKKWDEFGAIFITWPGGSGSKRYCAALNNATGAWMRCVGWDARCFIRLRGDCFFGTGDGIIMQMDRTGYDDGDHRKLPYVCTLVGGWEIFRSPSQQVVWHQARAVFMSRPNELFEPQLSATTDYTVTIPPPPPSAIDPGVAFDVWDEGLWDEALWDAGAPVEHTQRNTLWVSIGMTGFSHAPIVQVTVAQTARPTFELIAIAATYERAGVNV